MIEPTFLSLEEVLTLHADQLERYGGAAGIRDLGLLESAVETPRATFDGEFLHDGLFAMAAASAFHIAESQASLTETSAQASTLRLCSCSSMSWHVPDPGGLLYDAMIAISAKTMSKSELAALLQQLAVPDTDDDGVF